MNSLHVSQIAKLHPHIKNQSLLTRFGKVGNLVWGLYNLYIFIISHPNEVLVRMVYYEVQNKAPQNVMYTFGCDLGRLCLYQGFIL